MAAMEERLWGGVRTRELRGEQRLKLREKAVATSEAFSETTFCDHELSNFRTVLWRSDHTSAKLAVGKHTAKDFSKWVFLWFIFLFLLDEHQVPQL